MREIEPWSALLDEARADERLVGEAFEYADEIWAPVYTSNDAQEGPLAFREKRAPNWTGT